MFQQAAAPAIFKFARSAELVLDHDASWESTERRLGLSVARTAFAPMQCCVPRAAHNTRQRNHGWRAS